MFSSSLRQRAALGDVVEQRDQKYRLVLLVARDNAIGGQDALLRTALDHEFAAILAALGLHRRAIGRLDAGRGVGAEDLVGALADDVIARKPREALEGAVGEDVAAVLDVLGGDADRHVVEHRFQELLGRGELARKLALIGGVLMGGDRAAIGQGEMLDHDRTAVGQFGNKTFRRFCARW